MDEPLEYECACLTNNSNIGVNIQSDSPNPFGIKACQDSGGTLYGPGCSTPNYVPDVFLFSVILLIFTYVISIKLKSFTKTRFFSTKIRQYIADFAVPIAITTMTVVDNVSGIRTPKLEVPNDFKV